MKPLIIVGTGLAGYTLAREWRKLDPDGPLRMFSADDGAWYSKPMLSNAFDRGKTPQDLVLATAEQMAEELQAEIRTRCPVEAIDLKAGSLQLHDRKSAEYERLVLAVGATPIRPPLDGDAVEDICQVNSLQDYRQFRERLAGAKRIAIIGPGLIGVEFANDLVRGGFEPIVIGPAAYPLDRLLPPEIGAALQAGLARHGVRWKLGTTVRAVNRRNDHYRLELDNGEQLEADLVLSAIGLRPNIELAQRAGLRVNRGIVVDRYLQSSDPHVYALGDCAEVAGRVLPFVMPIMQGSRALARTLCGEPTPVTYPASPVFVKTPDFPLLVSPPAPGSAGQWQIVRQDENGIQAEFRDPQGRLLGFALSGDAVGAKNDLLKETPPILA